jgi:hypothetical protein|tara:strand:- start:1145 stop:1510 length:366 start_codon:yes stop_codon:yes gene_type:complete
MDLSSQKQYIQRATNAKLDLTSTSITTLYTAPTGGDFDFAIVESIIANNSHSGQAQITVTLTDTSSNVFTLYNTYDMATDTTHELLSRSLLLTAGEILKVTASAANVLNVVASVVEYAKGD